MPKRDEIKEKLITVYAALANMPQSSIDEDTNLANDLLLFATLRKGLADTYTRISRMHGGTRVTIPEAEKVETVKEAIELILSKT